MPKSQQVLTNEDKIVIEIAFPIYANVKHIEAFKNSFSNLHSQQKLSLALKHIEYSPFINALEQGEYQFFIDLFSALPRDTNKKLLLLYDDNEVIKKYIDSIVSNKKNLGDIIWKVNELLFSLLPETVKETSQEYIKNLYDENKINEEDRENLLIVFNHSYEIVIKSTENDVKNSDDETTSTELLSSESDQDIDIIGEISEDN